MIGSAIFGQCSTTSTDSTVNCNKKTSSNSDNIPNIGSPIPVSSTATTVPNNSSYQTTSTSYPDDNPGINKLYQLSENWLELESDPGVFTLVIRDFGCYEAEVEEIYDLQTPFTDDQKVYGFIFLFNVNVIEERRNRSQRHGTNVGSNNLNTSPSSLLSGDYITDEDFLKQVFFAYQKVPNSCATHAILSVLLNRSQLLDIGPTLMKLKEYTKDMSPEDKGYAISNMPELARAHNSHASALAPDAREQFKYHSNSVRVSQRNTSASVEAFHFVSFVPINGHLIELDGLKEWPIDHGPIDRSEPWTEKFRKLIRQRIETAPNGGALGDIRYNLMAVIPNKFHCRKRSLKCMEKNRILVLKILHFLEFYSTLQVLYEHNYSKFDSTFESTTFENEDPSSFKPFPSQENSNQNSSSLSVHDDTIISQTNLNEINNVPDCSSSVCSCSTETASDASSTYNFTFDKDDHCGSNDCQNTDLHKDSVQPLETEGQCQKFFVIKFESGTHDSQKIYSPSYEIDNKEITQEIIGQILEEIKSKLENDSTLSSPIVAKTEKSPTSSKNPGKRRQLTPGSGTEDVESFKKLKSDSHFQRNYQPPLLSTSVDPFTFDTNPDLLHQKFQMFREKIMSSTQLNVQLKPTILKNFSFLLSMLNQEISKYRREYEEEKAKLHRYKVDDSRRTFDYDELIVNFLAMLSEQGLLDSFLSQEPANPNDNYFPLSSSSVDPSTLSTFFAKDPTKVTIQSNYPNDEDQTSSSETTISEEIEDDELSDLLFNGHHDEDPRLEGEETSNSFDETSSSLIQNGCYEQINDSHEGDNRGSSISENSCQESSSGSCEYDEEDEEDDEETDEDEEDEDEEEIDEDEEEADEDEEETDEDVEETDEDEDEEEGEIENEEEGEDEEEEDDDDDENKNKNKNKKHKSKFEDNDTDMEDIRESLMPEFQMNGFFPTTFDLDGLPTTSGTSGIQNDLEENEYENSADTD